MHWIFVVKNWRIDQALSYSGEKALSWPALSIFVGSFSVITTYGWSLPILLTNHPLRGLSLLLACHIPWSCWAHCGNRNCQREAEKNLIQPFQICFLITLWPRSILWIHSGIRGGKGCPWAQCSPWRTQAWHGQTSPRVAEGMLPEQEWGFSGCGSLQAVAVANCSTFWGV